MVSYETFFILSLLIWIVVIGYFIFIYRRRNKFIKELNDILMNYKENILTIQKNHQKLVNVVEKHHKELVVVENALNSIKTTHKAKTVGDKFLAEKQNLMQQRAELKQEQIERRKSLQAKAALKKNKEE